MNIEICNGCGKCVSCSGLENAEYNRDFALDGIQELMESMEYFQHSMATDAKQKILCKFYKDQLKAMRANIGTMRFET